MRVVLSICLVASKLAIGASQADGFRPAWLDMLHAKGALAVRFPTDTPKAYLDSLASSPGLQGPTTVLNGTNTLLWNAMPNKKKVFALLSETSKESPLFGRKLAAPFVVVRVYRHRNDILIPTGKLVIAFKANASPSDALALLKKEGLKLIEGPDSFSPRRYLVEVPGDDGEKSVKLAHKISKRPNIDYVQPDLIYVSPRTP